MSWQATAWVKDLHNCPDGAHLSRGQKLLLFVLADYHNTALRQAWPSVVTLAGDADASLSQVKRDLNYLEEHLVLERCRPAKLGRGYLTAYRFLALDAPELLAERLSKRVQNEPLLEVRESKGIPSLSGSEPNAEGVHPDPKKGLERVQNVPSYIEEQRTPKQQKPPTKEKKHSRRALNPVVQKSLAVWLAAKQELRQEIGEEAWRLWIRPTMLLNVLSGNHLLLAIPPSTRIIEATRANQHVVHAALARRGCALAGFTSYPDEWTREQVAKRYPKVAATMLGHAPEDDS